MNFGIYTDRGYWTCEGRPGSAGFEEIDAKTFASWGVDYVKTDALAKSTLVFFGGHCNDVGMMVGTRVSFRGEFLPLKFWYHHHNIPRWYLFFGDLIFRVYPPEV